MSDADMLDEHYRKMGWTGSFGADPEYQKEQFKIMEETRARDAARNASRHNNLKTENTSVPDEKASVPDKGAKAQATQAPPKGPGIIQKIRQGLHM